MVCAPLRSKHYVDKSKSYFFKTNHPISTDTDDGLDINMVQKQDRLLHYVRQILLPC